MRCGWRTQVFEINLFLSLQWLALQKKNSMVWVRERTIPTERQPLIGEVIANFLRIEGATWSAWRIPTAVSSVFYTGAAPFLSSSSSVVLTRLSRPRSRPTTFAFLVVQGIEPGPPDLKPRTLTTRPQRRSLSYLLWKINDAANMHNFIFQ
jgi:hypothetical protein